jgi:hypothetical protein
MPAPHAAYSKSSQFFPELPTHFKPSLIKCIGHPTASRVLQNVVQSYKIAQSLSSLAPLKFRSAHKICFGDMGTLTSLSCSAKVMKNQSLDIS